MRRDPAGLSRPLSRSALLCAAALMLAGCEMRSPVSGIWSESNKLGPRIVQPGEPVPKGGGMYKVGSPYSLNGVTYTPSEVGRYDRTGIASWYGDLFHGRRTANGEIYDMEALTAAHPTLPLPSYVRVTNLENGRALVVRVNDRGPYARGRIIDLSWAVASLLQIHSAGTAPVRLQYLGPAPLSGDDSYERRVLASQPWAGPRVAFARSPAKAMRYHQAAADLPRPAPAPAAGQETAYRPARPAPVQMARLETREPSAPPPAPLARPAIKPHLRPQAKAQDKPHAHVLPPVKAAVRPSAPPQPKAVASIDAGAPKNASIAASYYVEAGLFNHKTTADEVAAILTEIAPVSVEPVTIGERAVHRIRLGPFTQDRAALDAVERIRAAGLTGAHVENSNGG